MFRNKFLVLISGILFSISLSTLSQSNSSFQESVSIKDIWVRTTNPGQDIGVAYMTFISPIDMTLSSIKSNVASSVEIHSMTMQNGVMKMRMLDKLQLYAHKPYKLTPGGYHLMLFNLKKQLKVGEQVNFVLIFDKNGESFEQNVNAIVQNQPKTDNTVH